MADRGRSGPRFPTSFASFCNGLPTQYPSAENACRVLGAGDPTCYPRRSGMLPRAHFLGIRGHGGSRVLPRLLPSVHRPSTARSRNRVRSRAVVSDRALTDGGPALADDQRNQDQSGDGIRPGEGPPRIGDQPSQRDPCRVSIERGLCRIGLERGAGGRCGQDPQ
jgi:hypothetical protein